MLFNKTIQMFIFDGNPNGRIMCELSNWNGRVYKVARNEIAEFSQRQDSENTGVYFLFGKDDNNNETIYIGEAERIASRLKQHLKDNEYWNDCVVVISKDDLLNKAHIKYMENKFYLLAQKSGRAFIINGNTPTCSSISEYDEAMLEEFISDAKLLVSTLGYKAFESIDDTAIKHESTKLLFIIVAARGADAKGTVVSDGFAVYKDSVVANSVAPSMSDNLIRLRSSLFDKGIIDIENTFTRDYVFTSPSLAASVVMGRNANGRTEWKTENRETINDLENFEI